MAEVTLRLLELLFWRSISSLVFPHLYSIGLMTSVCSSWVSIGVVTNSRPPCINRISGRWWSVAHFQLFYTKLAVNLATILLSVSSKVFGSPHPNILTCIGNKYAGALTLSVPQAVKRGSQILTFCTPSRETRLANKRLECESTIGR